MTAGKRLPDPPHAISLLTSLPSFPSRDHGLT